MSDLLVGPQFAPPCVTVDPFNALPRLFVNWRWIQRTGKKKPDKVPHDTNIGKALKGWTDPANLLPYDEVWRRVNTCNPNLPDDKKYGVGFIICAAFPQILIDVDNCLIGPYDPTRHILDQIKPEQCEFVRRFIECGAAWEVSSSGRGLHIIACVRDKAAFANCHSEWKSKSGEKYEFYRQARCCSFGPYGWQGNFNVDVTDILQAHVAAKLIPIRPKSILLVMSHTGPILGWCGYTEDSELIERMIASDGSSNAGFGASGHPRDLWRKNLDALRKLYQLSDDDASTGEGFDHSAADLALLGCLAFWTGCDAVRMERIFSLSALGQRDKWQDRPDYRERTIREAISGQAGKQVFNKQGVLARPTTDIAAITNKGGEITEHHAALGFAEQAEHRLLFVNGDWWYWTGQLWCKDTGQGALYLARMFCDYQTGGAKQFVKRSFIESVLKLASSDPRLVAREADFDADPMLLNTPGGVIDLRTAKMLPANDPRTGQVVTHDPRLLMTKMTAVTPDFDAPPLVWDRFLERIFVSDREMIDFIQRLCGYVLTGDTSEEILPFCYGLGGNGKSKLIEAISFVMGDYATVTASETLMAKYGSPGHPTELASLKGARLVTASEVEDGRKWDEARIKSLTGGDKISARLMRENFSSWKPTFKLLVSGNHRPQIRAVDDAIRRRMVLIPFTVTIPEGERDKKLEEKLRAEGPGILASMIRGCFEWQRIGLALPPAVISKTKEYVDGQDFIREFLREKCDLTDPNARTSTQQLYSVYLAHARDNREPELNKITFAQKLSDRGIIKSDTRTERGFRGIKIKNGAPIFGAVVPRRP